MTTDRHTAHRLTARRVTTGGVATDGVIARRPRRVARATDRGIAEPRTWDGREPVVVELADRWHEAARRTLSERRLTEVRRHLGRRAGLMRHQLRRVLTRLGNTRRARRRSVGFPRGPGRVVADGLTSG